MKIVVTGKMKENKISLSYRMFFASLIKNCLSKADKEYFDKIFFYEGKKSKKIKPFCFSVYLQDFKIKDDSIEVNGDVKFIISSADMKFNILIFTALMGMNSYGDFIKKSVKMQDDKMVEANECIMKTLSPIYMKNKDGSQALLDDENYGELFSYYADLILQSYRGYGLKEELQFIPLKMKKTVIKEEIQGFTEKTNKKFMYLNGYTGIFKLKGNVEDLNLLKELGVGGRRSTGFGNIDLV
ncbi:MAG: CRISPR-associated endoribonuclease Cas6 [Clostridium sp.]|uniref:CRISPR-associated endoribonuclease Cas6 n=1 Tax=Clostridium sp. TaxID=1506 RepID=UPI003F38C2D1